MVLSLESSTPILGMYTQMTPLQIPYLLVFCDLVAVT